LIEHYSNVHVVNSYEIPACWIDGNGVGHVPDDNDFGNMDDAAALMPYARFWILNINVIEPPMDTFPGDGSQVREDTFKDWVVVVRDHLALLGIDKSEWAFMFIDEPVDTEWTTKVVPLATWVKEVDPEILIYQNWNNQDVETLILAEGADLVDYYVPTHSRVKTDTNLRDFVAGLDAPSGKYDSSSAPDRDPYLDYRLSHWYAWDWGLNSNGKWTYIDTTHDIWNDYVGSIQAMVYAGEDRPISSKRWEAWRDGIEDFELMKLLQAEAESSGDPDLEALLEDVPAAILANTTDPTILDVNRLEILDALSP
jgi:hypothetical protein